MRRLADTAGGFEAVHHRHLAIHQHQMVGAIAATLRRLRRHCRPRRLGIQVFRSCAQSYDPVGGIVFCDQDSRIGEIDSLTALPLAPRRCAARLAANGLPGAN